MTPPTFVPSVFYREPLDALKWLERAFGFELTSLVTDGEGKLAHSEMSFRGGAIYVGGEWDGPPLAPARLRSPLSTDGQCTQMLRINLSDGLDAHFAQAKAAGANILAEPEDQFYGARIYRAMDPEGHVWVFSQEVRAVSADEMEAATGLKFRSSLTEA